jgi:hypothetical protein
MAHPEVVDRLAILNVAIRPPLLRALRADRGRVVSPAITGAFVM